ncbi:MAG: hypothetical protein JSV61_07320 [Anaerolineales bacterium]|nr:MAG: hypothetical protein JSV61_07320 [Anaerolineales bacterium]
MSDRKKKSSLRKRKRPRVLGCLLIILLVPVIYYVLYALLYGPRTASPQLIAHRGGRATTPENTLAAFRNAIALGADWLEFDVQRTSDGVLVVIHDQTVDRTTNGTGRVVDQTYEHLLSLDAGQGEKIPAFKEVITLAKEAGVGILPEIKSPDLYPGIDAQVLAEIKDADYLEHTGIQSFDHDLLEAVLRLEPQARVCPLYGLWQLNLKNPQINSAKTLCPMGEMVVLNPWMIRQAHQQGRQVYVWFGVIERPLVMRLTLALGADGLMVDDPATLAGLLGR